VRKTISPGKLRRLSSLQATPSPPPPSPLHPPLDDPADSRESKASLSHKHSCSAHLSDSTQTNSDHIQNQSDRTQSTAAASSVPTAGSSKPSAIRSLDFQSSSKSKTSSFTSICKQDQSKTCNVPTWAERVKGVSSSSHTVLKTQNSAPSDVSPARSALSDNGGKQPRKNEELRGSLGEESTARKVEETGGRSKVGEDGWETVTRGRLKSGLLRRFEESKIINSTMDSSLTTMGCEGEADEQVEGQKLVGGVWKIRAGGSGTASTEPSVESAGSKTKMEGRTDQCVSCNGKSEENQSASVVVPEKKQKRATGPVKNGNGMARSLDHAESMEKQLPDKERQDKDKAGLKDAEEGDKEMEDVNLEQGDKEAKDFSKMDDKMDREGSDDGEEPELEPGESEVVKAEASVERVAGGDALRDGGSSSSLVEPSVSGSVKMESLQLRLEELASAGAAVSKPESVSR